MRARTFSSSTGVPSGQPVGEARLLRAFAPDAVQIEIPTASNALCRHRRAILREWCPLDSAAGFPLEPPSPLTLVAAPPPLDLRGGRHGHARSTPWLQRSGIWTRRSSPRACASSTSAQHQPHPPGFPLYILAAKIVRPFVPTNFARCQTVTFLAACALFPLAFSLARELRFSFVTSYLGALLFVFFPNVWFYGGTAFSDIAGTAAAIAAAWLLFRGCRDARVLPRRRGRCSVLRRGSAARRCFSVWRLWPSRRGFNCACRGVAWPGRR